MFCLYVVESLTAILGSLLVGIVELIPVDLILSKMAEEAGFTVKEVIVARYKGNSSQQMKKYGRVPVRESIVVWEKQ